MHKKRTVRQYLMDYFVITLGSALMAFAVNFFFQPHQIVPGGVTGLAMLANHLFGLPVGVTIIVLNIPLFALSWRFAGHRFLIYTIYGTLASSLLIDLTSHMPTGANLEPLLAAIFGGLVMGGGLGFVFTRGATTGGSDVAARLLKLVFRHLQMGRLMLAIDLCIIVAAGFVFGDIKNVLYAIVTLYIATSVMDAILYGLNTARVAYVVSEHVEDVVNAIHQELDRGVTLLHGEGGYTGDPKKVILCAIKRNQIAHLKEAVKEVDPDAFLILTEAHEVLGEGFRDYDKHAM